MVTEIVGELIAYKHAFIIKKRSQGKICYNVDVRSCRVN